MGFKKFRIFKTYDLEYNKIASAMIIDKIFLLDVAKQKNTPL